MPAAATPMVADEIHAPPPGPAETSTDGLARVADPRGPLRPDDPGEADLWLGRARRHRDAEPALAHASLAIALMLDDHLSPRECRRVTRRWGRFD